jgi:hypothetical protein
LICINRTSALERIFQTIAARFGAAESLGRGVKTMTTVRIRLTGSADDARTLMTAIHALDGVERIEEVDDLTPHLDDEDSSSAGLSDDMGPGLHDIEIEAPHERAAKHVCNIAYIVSDDLGVPVEIVDEF